MTERITATVPQFCRLSGLGKTKVFKLIKNGTLESIKLGQSRLIVLASYQRLIEQEAAINEDMIKACRPLRSYHPEGLEPEDEPA